MKKLLIVLIIPMLFSCELTYDAETRMVFETTLQDSNGNVLQNVDVEVEASNYSNTEVISRGRTGTDGKIRLIFPKPNGSINILINDYYGVAPNEFQRKRLVNMNEDNFTNYKYSLHPLVLFKPAEVTTMILSYENVLSQYVSVRNIYISGLDPAEEINFNPDEGYNEMPYQIRVLKNSNIDLHYTLVNLGGEETQVSVPLSIGEESTGYTITY